MNDEALKNMVTRMKNEFYVGVVGSVRSGKSTFINSFFKTMILPKIDDEYIKQKITDELPQSSPGKQIMTVEPKFIPSASFQMNFDDLTMNLRFVDCVGEIIPNAEGYGTEKEPRLVKTPWFDEPISFKEAAHIGTEKVIYNHANLGIYLTSDGSFGDFSRTEYEAVEDELIPKLKQINKPFVIVLNTKDKNSNDALLLKKSLENKWNVNTIVVNAQALDKDDCNLILTKALEEFPINNLSIALPDYLDYVGEDITLKKNIVSLISENEAVYTKIKEVNLLCDTLRNSNIFSKVTLELLDNSEGNVNIVLDLDDSKYKEIVDELVGDAAKSKASFVKFLYQARKNNNIYDSMSDAINDAINNGYGVSVPNINDMTLIPPSITKKNGMYGVKLAAKAKCIHMIAVDMEASFTPIIGSLDQSKMLMNSLTSDNDDNIIWKQEFFGKKLSDIISDTMKGKILNLGDNTKDKLKHVLEKLMNSERNNLIAIII